MQDHRLTRGARSQRSRGTDFKRTLNLAVLTCLTVALAGPVFAPPADRKKAAVEALMKDEAIANYQKALELNPSNRSAAEALAKLQRPR